MRIAVHSASLSVTRTLESIIAASGHQFSANGLADYVLVDHMHPSHQPIPDAPALILHAEGAEPSPDVQALTCPVKPARLLQRLTMLGSTQRLTLSNGWSLDMLARALTHETCPPLSLTEKECVLLKHLLHAHPQALSREDLLEQVWGMAGEIDTHTLETHIYRLRSKFDGASPRPCDILTQGGAYVLALATNPD
jgi:hypothetical protein